MQGAFLLSFVLRLSSCAVRLPALFIYSCQPIPRCFPTQLVGFGVVYPQPRRTREVSGWWVAGWGPCGCPRAMLGAWGGGHSMALPWVGALPPHEMPK